MSDAFAGLTDHERWSAWLLAEAVDAMLPLRWAETGSLPSEELVARARLASWRFHGGAEDGTRTGGENMAAGDGEGAGTGAVLLADMIACVTVLESRQPRPRPVRLLGREWSYPGRAEPTGEAVTAADGPSLERYGRSLGGGGDAK